MGEVLKGGKVEEREFMVVEFFKEEGIKLEVVEL